MKINDEFLIFVTVVALIILAFAFGFVSGKESGKEYERNYVLQLIDTIQHTTK